MDQDPKRFVSRGGLKLEAALSAFGLDVGGCVCADLGCNVGGFTDCLLQRGAARVYAVDTGYGTLAWTLRKDPRVVVMERTNALHVCPPERVDLVTVDTAWTCQEHIAPAAMNWLRAAPGAGDGLLPCVVSLLKPHYELARRDPRRRRDKSLTDAEADDVCRTVSAGLVRQGWTVRDTVISPVRGKGGNVEFLLLLTRDLQDGLQ